MPSPFPPTTKPVTEPMKSPFRKPDVEAPAPVEKKTKPKKESTASAEIAELEPLDPHS